MIRAVMGTKHPRSGLKWTGFKLSFMGIFKSGTAKATD